MTANRDGLSSEYAIEIQDSDDDLDLGIETVRHQPFSTFQALSPLQTHTANNAKKEQTRSARECNVAQQQQEEQEEGQQLSDVWHQCYHLASTISSVGNPFVDPDFPPVETSLDGRQRPRSGLLDHNDQQEQPRQKGGGDGGHVPPLILCKCRIPAAARTVQSEGPNYGRFYLICGRNSRGKKTNNRIRINHTTNSTISNDDDDDDKNSNNQSISSPCSFFQWDPDGSIGALGYSTRYSLLGWQHFGIENNCCLYRKSIHSSQVRQGAVGNCWFLSALTVVTEKPFLIQRILPHLRSTLNDMGIYQINLCMDGQWTPILVDSNLPVVFVDPTNNKSKGSLCQERLRGAVIVEKSNLLALPAFCAAPDRQIWAPLVEKAYAKAHGCYALLSGGFIAEGMQDLTGAPTETIIFQNGFFNADTFWDQLRTFHQDGFVMGVATAGGGGNGLVGQHAYSVLDVVELPHTSVGAQSKVTDFFINSLVDEKNQSTDLTIKRAKTTVRLVRIRNPWGSREWKGAWSAESDKWTTAIRERIGSTTYSKGDGTFFMSYEDMLTRFHHIDVCKTRQGWFHASSEGFFASGTGPMDSSRYMYILRPSKTMSAYVSIIQPKKRANTKSRYWYTDPSFLLLKRLRSTDDWAFDSSITTGIKRSSCCQTTLDPEYEYCCVPFSFKANLADLGGYTFRLVVYSSEELTIDMQPCDRNNVRSAVILLHQRLLLQELKLLFPVSSDGVLSSIYGDGCLYFVAMNGHDDSFLSIRLSIEIPNGTLLIWGSKSDTHDIAPVSQKLLAVVSSTGKSSSSAKVVFNYLTDRVPTAQKGSFSHPEIGGNVALNLYAELLIRSIDPCQIRIKGTATVDISFWIAELGRAPSSVH